MELADFYGQYPIKMVKVGNKNWEYIAKGSGKKTFLILPGGGQTAQNTFDLIQTLETDYKVIAITIHNADSINEVLHAVEVILEKEHAKKIILYGLSLGGMVAQSFLKRHPSQVEKAIFSHTPFPTSPFYKSQIIRPLRCVHFLLPFIPEKLLAYVTKRMAASVQGVKGSSYIMSVEEVDEYTKELRKLLYRDFYENYFNKRLLQTWIKLHFDFYKNERFTREDANRWHGKLLVLHTDNDPLVQNGSLFTDLYPRVQTHMFKSTGHLTFHYKSKEVISIIKQFIR